MKQGAAVRFLILKRSSAKGVWADLEGVYGLEALCLSPVRKWRNGFANGRIALEDDPRSGRPPQNDLSESIRALIETSPFLLCKPMCQKLRMAKKTCLHVLHKSLGFRKCYVRWVPHLMTENEAQSRMVFAEELLQVMRHARETNCDNSLTGDESWFHYEHPYDPVGAPSRDALPTRASKTTESQKCLVSIILPTSGI
jgi:hypothetical protein